LWVAGSVTFPPAVADQMTTVATTLDQATATGRRAGLATPRLDAEILLRSVLAIDRTTLFDRLPDTLDPAALLAFDRLFSERLAGTSVAYLVGQREFMGLPFVVRHGVLVPRPETEGLVEWAEQWLASRPKATVVDVGTGSGAIALSLASRANANWEGRIIGADLSGAALAVAEENRRQLGQEQRVGLVRGDLLRWCGGPVDLIVANLPYLRPEQVAGNRELAAEPALALIGGEDGLGAIRRLVADAPRLLAVDGAVGLEIDPSQAAAVVNLVGGAWPGANIVVRPDLAGDARHVVVTLGM